MREPDYEQLTLSAEDFPASPFPWLESKKAKGTTVISGRKCSELSESLRRVGLSVRTYLESCELPGKQFARNWSVRDTLSPYLILKLRLSERPIDDKDASLWPTPTVPNGGRSVKHVTDWRSERTAYHNGHKVQIDLNAAVKMWPTPKARDYKDTTTLPPSRQMDSGKDSLSQRVGRLLPTPNARDWKNATAAEWDNPGNTRNLNRFIAKQCEGSDIKEERLGQLNPTWVEWLMGFPLGWTDLSASETR